jgi:hypothetical protein
VVEAKPNFRELAHGKLWQPESGVERLMETLSPTIKRGSDVKRTLAQAEEMVTIFREQNPEDYEVLSPRLGLVAREIALSGIAAKIKSSMSATSEDPADDIQTEFGGQLTVCIGKDYRNAKKIGNRLCITIQKAGEDPELKKAMGRWGNRTFSVMINIDAVDYVDFGELSIMPAFSDKGRRHSWLNSYDESLDPHKATEYKDFKLAAVLLDRIKGSEKYQAIQTSK